MKSLHYDEIIIPPNIQKLERKLTKEITSRIIELYSGKNDAQFCLTLALTHQLGYILAALSGDIKGKTILDLGCGSNTPQLENMLSISEDRMYEPWVCRFLYEAGADVIGIDLGDLSLEKFRHYQADLTEPNSLDTIMNLSVDLVNARQLFSSPVLDFIIRSHKSNSYDFMSDLKTRLDRILKPEGKFIYKEI